MAGRDWERFGDEIRRTIQDAVDSRDFGRLNQTITDTINNAVGNIKEGVKNGGWYGAKEYERTAAGEKKSCRKAWEEPLQKEAVKEKRLLYLKGTSTKIGGTFLCVTGYAFGAVSLILFVILLVASGMAGDFGLPFKAAAIFLAVLLIGCGIMAGVGTSMLGKIKRFRTYIRAIGGREYCEIKELSSQSGKSARYIVKDLEDMIEKGWFCQGHLDMQKTCLMVSEDAYNQYKELMERQNRQRTEEENMRSRKEEEEKRLSPQVQEVIRAGEEYVRKIRQCNDAIPGEEISAKISHMELLIGRIFDRVKQAPESVADIRRLMEYYLPTTVKLLEAYEELDAQPIQGENITSSKTEIEKTLDTLNIAFEKLLDDLFQDTAWDVSSDISVLHTMLAQEGLTEDEISGK